MIYLLDTNVCIRFMNGRAPGVLQRLQKNLIESPVVILDRLRDDVRRDRATGHTGLLKHRRRGIIHFPGNAVDLVCPVAYSLLPLAR